jgi:hypothetical protein
MGALLAFGSLIISETPRLFFFGVIDIDGFWIMTTTKMA